MSPAGSSHNSPYSSQREHKPLDKGEDEDDKHSTMSQASGIPRAEHALDALRFVAGNRVRHARCAPEFLEEIATKDAHTYLKKAASKKFKVVAGPEARTFFRNYISNHNKAEAISVRTDNDKVTNEVMPAPIVFAVTVWEAGIKCVDYYMTWRGNKKARQSRDFERRVDFLDAEFRRLAKTLDDDFKRISSLRKHDNLSPVYGKFDIKPRSPHSSHKSRPPGIMVSTPEEPSKLDELINPTLPEPPVSAADSVMSLPLLNMVRNVPFSHRVPLRVTNPDRLSIISDVDIPVTENYTPSNTLSLPAVHRVSKHKADDTVKKSSASIHSSDRKSSRSSRPSRSSSRSENKSSRSSSPGDRHKGHDSSRRGEKYSFKDEEVPEFLIILLGDKLDRDTTSWHGLERQTSVRSLPPDRHSPWIGPLARSDSIGLRHSPAHTPNDSDDGDSGDEQRWSSPVIPMKPLMEAMGLIPSYYRPPPVIPGGQYISIGKIGSPASNQSPYLYSSPRVDTSPYVPSWLPQLQIPSSAPTSRPPSRAYSSASYASPYMQSHLGPF